MHSDSALSCTMRALPAAAAAAPNLRFCAPISGRAMRLGGEQIGGSARDFSKHFPPVAAHPVPGTARRGGGPAVGFLLAPRWGEIPPPPPRRRLPPPGRGG